MELGIKISVYAIAFIIGVMWLDESFDLISSPSDFKVILGVVMLCALISLVIERGSKINWRSLFSKINPPPAIIVLCFMAASLMGGCAKVTPAYVGIKVDNYGTYRGVQDLPIVTGMVWYNPFTTSVFEFPTFVQTATFQGAEAITYNSKDGMTFAAPISFSYQVISEKAPHFYVKFKSDNMGEFTKGFFHNIVRDAFNEVAQNYSTDELYGDKKQEVIMKVKEMVNSQTQVFGIDLVQMGYIGAPLPPQNIIDGINLKVGATQRAMQSENELAFSKAEAAKAVAKAQGEANANKILSESLTPNLLEWRRLQLTEQAIGRWNGSRPMVEGSGSGLLLNIAPPSPGFLALQPQGK